MNGINGAESLLRISKQCDNSCRAPESFNKSVIGKIQCVCKHFFFISGGLTRFSSATGDFICPIEPFNQTFQGTSVELLTCCIDGRDLPRLLPGFKQEVSQRDAKGPEESQKGREVAVQLVMREKSKVVSSETILEMFKVGNLTLGNELGAGKVQYGFA